MPYINGRYYMNPQYGAALEQTREADEGDDSDAQSDDTSVPQVEYVSTASAQQYSQHEQKAPRQFSGDATSQSSSMIEGHSREILGVDRYIH